MVKNGIVVVIIINFVTAWGEYLLARDDEHDPNSADAAGRSRQSAGGMGGWAWPRIAAVYIMAITPGLVAFGFAQRWYMKGLQEGALKA